LQDINQAAHPLDKDHVVAEAWRQPGWADYSGVGVFSGADSQLALKLNSNQLALTLVSGTNKEYEIHCRMVDTGMWDLGE